MRFQVLELLDDAESARRLQREYKARRESGLECSWLSAGALSEEAGVNANGAIRTGRYQIAMNAAPIAAAANSPAITSTAV